MHYYAALDPSEVRHGALAAAHRALVVARRDLRFPELEVAFFRPENAAEAAERAAWDAAVLKSSRALLRASIEQGSRPRIVHRTRIGGLVMRCMPDHVWLLATLPIARIPGTLFHEARHAAQLRSGLDGEMAAAALEYDANRYAARSLRLLEVR